MTIEDLRTYQKTKQTIRALEAELAEKEEHSLEEMKAQGTE